MKRTMQKLMAMSVVAFAATLHATVTNVIGTLELTTDRTLDLADGSVTVVSNLTGGAYTLTVQGSGRLVVHRFSNPDARIEMGSGTTLEARCAVPDVCSKAFFHVDACAVDTLTFSPANGTNFVSTWADVRGTDYPYAHDYTSVVGVRNPFITPCHYNGRDVMDFGSIWQSGNLQGWGGTLVWSSTACTRPVEVFMSAGDTPDAKDGVDGTGSSHRNNSLFGHNSSTTGIRGNGSSGGTSQLLLSGSLLNTQAGMSFTVDGVARTATSYQLPDGMHVISCHATQSTYIDGTGMQNAPIAYFARERNVVFGGLRIGEYIVFTNELTSAERAEVNDYFDVKWRTEQKVASLSLADGASLALPDGMNLVVTGEYDNAGAVVTGPGRLTAGSAHFSEFTLDSDTIIDVPADSTYTFDVLNGTGGLLTKTGAGTLVIGFNKAVNATFSVSEGTLSFPPLDIPSCDDILAKAYFHVDASEASSLTFNTVNGTNFVTRWNDVRGDGYPYATKLDAAPSYPYIGADETTGKTVVDFGTTSNRTTRTDGHGAALYLNHFTGYRPMDIFIVERHNADMRQIIAPVQGNLGTDYRNQALLGSAQTGFVPGNPVSGQDSVAILGSSALMYTKAAASCRIDAGFDDLSASQLLSYYPGYDQHVYGFYPTSSDYINGTDEIKFYYFACERGNIYGGQTLGEVVIFTNLLTAAQRDAMNMHLTMKWKPSVFEDMVQADVVMTDGTTWDMGWMNLMATNSLVLGGGTLNVKSLSAPASITLTEPATVGGALVLPDGEVEVTFVGNEWISLLREGSVKVLGATSVSGSPRLVARFEPTPTNRTVTFSIGEDGIYASSRSGLAIIIR